MRDCIERESIVGVRFEDGKMSRCPLGQALDFVRAFEGRAAIVDKSGRVLVDIRSVDAFAECLDRDLPKIPAAA